MSEETQDAVIEEAAPASGEVAPEQDAKVEQQAEEATDSEQKSSAEDAAAENKPKFKGGFQKRIDELTRERYELQREKDRLLAIVEGAVGKPKASEQAAAPAEPKETDFERYEDYQRALSRHEAQQEARRVLAEERRQAEQDRQQQESAKLVEQWQAKEAEARAKFEDYDDAIAAAVPLSRLAAQAVMESDHGPAVAYYLATHAEENRRIAALSPSSQIREIGKLEERLSRPVKASAAPEPIKPVGTRSAGSNPLGDNVPMSQWAKNFEKMYYGSQR